MPEDHRPGADATFDVVVLGGGPAGSAAAVTLARDGRSVLVVDNGRGGPGFGGGAGDSPRFLVGEGGPPGLDRAVVQVFGPDGFARDDHLPSFANRALWGSEQPTETEFLFNPFGNGWHLDRVAFNARLLACASAAGATIWTGTVRWDEARAEPVAIAHDAGGGWHRERPWTLSIETASGALEVDASIVCDASGRGAAFARRHGGELTVHDRLFAVVAVYDATPADPGGATPADPEGATPADAGGATAHDPDLEPAIDLDRAGTGTGTGGSDPHGGDDVSVAIDDDLLHRALVSDLDSATTLEAVPDGWWYTAAIPHRRRVVAFFSDGDLVPPAMRTIEGFGAQLGSTRLVADLVTGSPLGYALHSPPRFVAAGTSWLARPSGPGWLAAGDAAACFDPLSSQGTLTAVLMGRTAADAAISLLVAPDAGTEAYDERYRTIVDRFLVEQRETYSLERRWPDAPFWSRRHAPPTPRSQGSGGQGPPEH